MSFFAASRAVLTTLGRRPLALASAPLRRASVLETAAPMRGFSTAQPLSAPTPVEVEEVPETPTSPMATALKPREVVEQLDQFIVGQPDAKRAVAIALRNRWRRYQLPEDLKPEVIPKNILMIGPTGCGKTEIARRIAKLSQAPFIKVEATKFTEVGFHGKDVDQIIKDLVDVGVQMTKKRIKEQVKEEVSALVEEKLLDLCVGKHVDSAQREHFRTFLRDGSMEQQTLEMEVPVGKPNEKNIVVDQANLSSLSDLFGKMAKQGGARKSEKKKLTIAAARPILEEMEVEKMLEQYDIVKEAIAGVEESGIVFIDEVDKLVSTGDYKGADASSEGVQRDLLPMIEGSTISTKYGNVNTDHILFIASGAFHSCKPSDLLAELQGRLPIRVTLKGLTEEDLYRILTEPITNQIRQQKEMLRAENINLEFTDGAIREIARIAAELNRTVDNIGARRLHTVMERIMEEISFDAPDREPGSSFLIDVDYVQSRVKDFARNVDLRKYIL